MLNVVIQPKTRLALDWASVKPLEIDAIETIRESEGDSAIEGDTDEVTLDKARTSLHKSKNAIRLQTTIFDAAVEILRTSEHSFEGTEPVLVKELIRLTNSFLHSDRIRFYPPVIQSDNDLRTVLLSVSMRKIIRHLLDAIRNAPLMELKLLLEEAHPIASTFDHTDFCTVKPTVYGRKSHISRTICERPWESATVRLLDDNPSVSAWVRNDHLGFSIKYLHNGVIRKYVTDFFVVLSNGKQLIVKVKEKDRFLDASERRAVITWVNAVNAHGGFGRWHFIYAYDVKEIDAVIDELC